MTCGLPSGSFRSDSALSIWCFSLPGLTQCRVTSCAALVSAWEDASLGIVAQPPVDGLSVRVSNGRETQTTTQGFAVQELDRPSARPLSLLLAVCGRAG